MGFAASSLIARGSAIVGLGRMQCLMMISCTSVTPASVPAAFCWFAVADEQLSGVTYPPSTKRCRFLSLQCETEAWAGCWFDPLKATALQN